MPDKKIIAVTGATGAQGGGLVRAILDDPSGGFTARALTRNVHSEKALALGRRARKWSPADVDDAESLRKAFEGAYGAYCVTFYWDHFSPERELAQAQALANAAKAGGRAARRLVQPRGYAPLGAARRPPHAHPDGQVQGAALRRQRRGQPLLHRCRRAHHASC